MIKVDLTKKPYCLDDEAIKWVKDTIAGMSLDEKIGQLFVGMTGGTDEALIKKYLGESHIGGARFMSGTAKDMYTQNVLLQKHSKIPLLIATNAEHGGAGACTDGTNVGMPIKVAATNDTEYAYKLGKISAIESKAIATNWIFAPIVDILMNWRNPVIASRAFSDNPDTVLEMSKAYYRGVKEEGLICAMKHFPGDGVDERDQHLSSSVNSLTCEEWDASFGKVYKGMIDEGVEAVMAGHIMMPAYQRHFSPGTKIEELMPATLCKELLDDLLRGKLGFNGLIVTDASHMVGMTGRMARKDLVPAAIAAGCDMFLFFNQMEEDFKYMKDAVESGVITAERLEDALTRILGLKARLGLHNTPKDKICPDNSLLPLVACDEHKKVASEISKKAITLAKQTGENLFPISPIKNKKILIVPVGDDSNPVAILAGHKSSASPYEIIKKELEDRGFEVEIFNNKIAKLRKIASVIPPKMLDIALKLFSKKLSNPYGHKESIEGFKAKYDLVISVANVNALMQTVQRLSWAMPKGGFEIPWYVNDMPTIFVSLSGPFHLADVPQVKNYINCYDSQEHTIKALVAKLCGESEFTSISPVDVFCQMEDTRI